MAVPVSLHETATESRLTFITALQLGGQGEASTERQYLWFPHPSAGSCRRELVLVTGCKHRYCD